MNMQCLVLFKSYAYGKGDSHYDKLTTLKTGALGLADTGTGGLLKQNSFSFNITLTERKIKKLLTKESRAQNGGFRVG